VSDKKPYFEDPDFGQKMHPGLAPGDYDDIWGNIQRELPAHDAPTARRPTTWVAIAAAALLIFSSGILATRWMERSAQAPNGEPIVAEGPDDPRPEDPPPEPPTLHETLELAKGSKVELPDSSFILSRADDTHISFSQHAPDRVEVELARGDVLVDVARNESRAFVVRSEETVVTVLGTSFTVTRGADSSVGVEVVRGLVRVEAPGVTREIGPGERVDVPAKLAVVDPVESAPELVEDDLPAPRKSRRPRKKKKDWKRLAREKSFEDARDRILEDEELVRDTPLELMLAADTMRYAGRPEKAAVYLDRLLTKHGKDARAPVAAFTRGKVLMSMKGRKNAREAARMFALVATLDPRGSLAEDALAREVEAWHRAGDAERARSRAQDYLDAYPNGSRSYSVKRFGGLPTD